MSMTRQLSLRPAGSVSGGFSQRQSMPQAAPSSGQPRPIRRLGRAGRAYRPCSRNRRTCGRQGRQGAHAAATRAPARSRQGRRQAPVDARVLHPRPGAGGAHGPWRLGVTVSGGCGRCGVPPREKEIRPRWLSAPCVCLNKPKLCSSQFYKL